MDWSAVAAIAGVLAALAAAISAVASWRAVHNAAEEAKEARGVARAAQVEARDARAAEIIDRAPILDLSPPRATFYPDALTLTLVLFNGIPGDSRRQRHLLRCRRGA